MGKLHDLAVKGQAIWFDFIQHSLVIAAIEHMISLGAQPPVWRSANAPGGDEANKRYIAEYMGRIRHL